MAWDGSGVFSATIADILDGTSTWDLDAVGTLGWYAALYNNSVGAAATEKIAAAADVCYGKAATSWVGTNEVYDGTDWDQGGEPVQDGRDITRTNATVTFDADNVSQGGTTCTLADVYGCLVYDDDQTNNADQAFCFNYFSGVQSVTAGTFTIVWHVNGIATITV